MSHFCLLRDPAGYTPTDKNLTANAESRAYWLDLFSRHFEDTMRHALHRYGPRASQQIEEAQREFGQCLEALRVDSEGKDAGFDVLSLCRSREKALRDNGLPDPFGHIKERENVAAIELYEEVVRNTHAMPHEQRWLQLVRGVFAGNLFDLGSPATMHLASESPDFLATLDEVRARPWVVDDFDTLLSHLPASPPPRWGKAIVLVDNAGSDFILGLLPLVRELALAGTQIVLAANELPTLNDLTADETMGLLGGLSAMDPDLDALIVGKMLSVVSTGTDTPLIDLSEVSDELNEAAEDADLLVLEGMGRAIESNFDASFRVDCLRLALLKDPHVAASIGGGTYDCVCKYTPIED